MSESAIRTKINTVVGNDDVRECLNELLDFEVAASGPYKSEYKKIIESHTPNAKRDPAAGDAS